MDVRAVFYLQYGTRLHLTEEEHFHVPFVSAHLANWLLSSIQHLTPSIGKVKAYLVIECVDESSRFFTAANNGMWSPFSTGDLSLYRAKVHSLSCLANSFFFHDISFSSLGESVPGIFPLQPNLPIFTSSLQGRILSSLFWFCGEPVSFLLRAFVEFLFFVLILIQHETCVMTTSNSWWCYFSVVEIIHCSMN